MKLRAVKDLNRSGFSGWDSSGYYSTRFVLDKTDAKAGTVQTPNRTQKRQPRACLRVRKRFV